MAAVEDVLEAAVEITIRAPATSVTWSAWPAASSHEMEARLADLGSLAHLADFLEKGPSSMLLTGVEEPVLEAMLQADWPPGLPLQSLDQEMNAGPHGCGSTRSLQGPMEGGCASSGSQATGSGRMSLRTDGVLPPPSNGGSGTPSEGRTLSCLQPHSELDVL